MDDSEGIVSSDIGGPYPRGSKGSYYIFPVVRKKTRMSWFTTPTSKTSLELNEEEAKAAIRRLVDKGVEAIAVCLLNSFGNPAHERLIG